MKTLISIFTSLIVCCFTIGASAQSAIDKVIEKIEKDPSANVICTEKRNPGIKKVYKMSKVIKINNGSVIKELRDAIIAESENAIEYTRIDNRFYSVKYITEEKIMEYSLSMNSQKRCVITIEIINYKNGPKDSRGNYIIGGNFILDESALERLMGGVDSMLSVDSLAFSYTDDVRQLNKRALSR